MTAFCTQCVFCLCSASPPLQRTIAYQDQILSVSTNSNVQRVPSHYEWDFSFDCLPNTAWHDPIWRSWICYGLLRSALIWRCMWLWSVLIFLFQGGWASRLTDTHRWCRRSLAAAAAPPSAWWCQIRSAPASCSCGKRERLMVWHWLQGSLFLALFFKTLFCCCSFA